VAVVAILIKYLHNKSATSYDTEFPSAIENSAFDDRNHPG